jgi:hypothetical protein
MTSDRIDEWKKKIDAMSHSEMASLWRFAPAGHPVFDSTLPLFNYFKTRFDSMGGFTPEISKKLGWEN